MQAANNPVLNPSALPQRERDEVDALYAELNGKGPLEVVSSAGRRTGVPASLRRFLLALLRDLRNGKTVTAVPSDRGLTTQEASSILGTSRQYLVNLLDSGAIPHHVVGSHRRVGLEDLLRYKRDRDRVRRKILARMVKSEADEGLYNLIPDHVQPIQPRRRPV